MRLREIQQRLTDCKQDSDLFEEAIAELKDRIEFVEILIQFGLDLNDEFCWNYLWNGE